MTDRWIAAIILCASGCTIGFGSPYVGQWRAHEAVAFEVCVEDAAGNCVEEAAVTEQKPARRFWGFAMSYPMLGLARMTIAGETQSAFRLDINAEYLRGKGRFAYGLRSSVVIDIGSDTLVTTPIMGMAHVGLSERFSFYGGVGFSPFSRLVMGDSDGGEGRAVTSNALGRVLGGVQLVGSRSQRDARILYTIEADSMLSSFEGMSYRSWGITASIGVFF